MINELLSVGLFSLSLFGFDYSKTDPNTNVCSVKDTKIVLTDTDVLYTINFSRIPATSWSDDGYISFLFNYSDGTILSTYYDKVTTSISSSKPYSVTFDIALSSLVQNETYKLYYQCYKYSSYVENSNSINGINPLFHYGTAYNDVLEDNLLNDVILWNESITVGGSIIDSITSGLGLMTILAGSLLTAFSTLFWNSATSSLTTLGMFALIFLGVAITFAVIKLALYLIRSKSGM